MKRLPRWLPAWLAVVMAAILVGTAAGTLWYNSYLRRTVMDLVRKQVNAAGEVTIGALQDWGASRRAQATLLARLVAPRAETAAGHGTDSTLRVFVEEEAFESGAVLDHSRRVVSQYASGATHPVDRLDGPRAVTLGGDAAAVRVQLGEQQGVAVDFSAPIVSRGATLGWVVLRARFGPDAWAYLHAVAAQPDVGRTIVVAGQGDSAQVVTVRAASPPPHSSRAVLRRDLPEFARQALGGERTLGVGEGLYGSRVVYAAVPTVGLPWAVVREFDMVDLDTQLNQAILLNDSIFSLIGLLLVGILAGVSRVAYLRRESASAQLRSDFVSSVSHELRTPLTQIRMYAEMLQKGLLPVRADADRAMHVIEKEAERLTLLVDKVLNFTSLRRNIRRVDAEPLPLTDGIRQATTAFAPLAAERDAHVIVDVADATRARIGAEALQQIMLNLLENAAKYGPRGQTIRVGAVEYSDVTRIWVDDEGPGVPVAEREAIWKAFHRGSHADGSGENGSGIGLAVVRELAVQHGGRAYVKSAPSAANGSGKQCEGGARFVVELPASGKAG